MSVELGKILQVVFLLVVAGGLVWAAFYGLHGRPASAAGRERNRRVVNGFRLAGGILLGFVLVGTFVAGIGVGFLGSSARFSSKPLAIGLAVISLTFIVILVQRWARYLGGWVGYGALNGLLMASSGHLVNNSAIPVRRSSALMMTGIAMISAVVCLRFTEEYKLNLVDKTAVIGWVVCFAVAANVAKYGLAFFTLAGAGLVLAWLHHSLTNRPRRHRRRHVPTPKAV